MKPDLGIRWWWVGLVSNQTAAGSTTLQSHLRTCSLDKAQEWGSKNRGKLSLHKYSNFPGCKSKQGFQEAERVKSDRCLSLSKAVWKCLVHAASVRSPLQRAARGEAGTTRGKKGKREKATAAVTTLQNLLEGQLGALGHKGEM